MSLTNEKFKKSFLFYIAILQLLVATWATFVIEGGTFKMKLIQLTKGKFAQVDDEDYEWLNQYKWVTITAPTTNYASSSLNAYGTKFLRNREFPRKKLQRLAMHRILLGASAWQLVDHIDGNGLNNQKSNLRLATIQQNTRNRKNNRNSMSKYKGVTLYRGVNRYRLKSGELKVYEPRHRWGAKIIINGIQTHLGVFEKEDDAAIAYNNAALKHYGEFARLNVIDK